MKSVAWKQGRRRPEAVWETFVDPIYPDEPFSICLRPLNMLEVAAAQDAALEYQEMYCGEAEDGSPKVFTFPDGSGSVRLTENMARELAFIEAMQPEDLPASERYTFGELVGVAVTQDGIFRQILMRVQEIALGDGLSQDPAGNSPGAARKPSSGPPSPSTSDTPPSNGGTHPLEGVIAPASGASTGASALSSPLSVQG